jgi:hypothetical protein
VPSSSHHSSTSCESTYSFFIAAAASMAARSRNDCERPRGRVSLASAIAGVVRERTCRPEALRELWAAAKRSLEASASAQQRS